MNRLGRLRIPFFFVIDFDFKVPFCWPLHQVDASSLRFEMEGFGQKDWSHDIAKREIRQASNFLFDKNPMPFEAYNAIFEKTMVEIRYGNSYLVNLTQPTPVTCSLSILDIFERSQAKFKLWFDDRFVVFSPERFIRIVDRKISTFPMKGTIDATLPDAEAIILADQKEQAEHFTIVDLLRNDLNRVAKNIQVERFRYIDRIETERGKLLQVSSDISGILPSEWNDHIGDILAALLPAGSISGAPKRKTVEIIHAVERYERGYYTGIFGYFDGISLDSAVMIRYIERKGDQLIFKSGGGITALSEARSEYQELIDKVYVPIVRNYSGH